MYLHSRATGGDFVETVRLNRHKFSTGVVHSFTGDSEELQALINMDLYIGINGCSLKTFQNCEIVKTVPLDRLMVETDCPYCDIRNSHESAKYVETRFPSTKKDKYNPSSPYTLSKARNEPVTIV